MTKKELIDGVKLQADSDGVWQIDRNVRVSVDGEGDLYFKHLNGESDHLIVKDLEDDEEIPTHLTIHIYLNKTDDQVRQGIDIMNAQRLVLGYTQAVVEETAGDPVDAAQPEPEVNEYEIKYQKEVEKNNIYQDLLDRKEVHLTR